MNAFSPDDFGDTSDLLRALGLVDAGGGFNGAWLGDPERYLKTILADEGQRQALLDFVAAMREGETERDAANRIWIALFGEPLDGGARIDFHLVVDEEDADEVRLFLGVRFTTQAPLTESASSLMIPLFRAGKAGRPPPDTPFLAGEAGGEVALTTEVTIAASAALPGEAGLRAVGLRLSVPTEPGGGTPTVALSLRGLQLPGESSGRDLDLSLTDPAALRDAGLDLIVALIKAQADNATVGSQIEAFTRMLGLAGDAAIPDLPVEDLFTRGLDALGDWLAEALGEATARAAWLQALADLLANGASAGADHVTLPVGGASVRLGLTAVPGASGRPVITVSVSFGMTSGTAEAALSADLVRIDLGARTAVAVPRLGAEARFDLSGVVMPDVSVERLVVGAGLDASRRPVLVVELRNAVVFSTTHPRLDLTNPDALAAAAAAAATDALTEMLGDLGPAGNLIAVALGWAAPSGAGAGYPTIDLIGFLGDPVGRLRAHWTDVVTNHAAEMPAVLADLRHLITGDATPGAVTGSGTDAAPWQLPLEAGLHVAVWQDTRGRLFIGLGFARSVDTLGERCTVIDSRLRAAVVMLDFEAGAAGFMPEIVLRVLGRARGGGRLASGRGSLAVEVDHVGARALWTPDRGLTITAEAPDPVLRLDGVDLPLDLPPIGGDFSDFLDTLTDAQWDALEQLAALVAEQIEAPGLRDLVEALGWRRPTPILGGPPRHRLRLARLVVDPQAALWTWLADLLADAEADLAWHLQPLARFLSGRPDASFSVAGRGTFADPWRVTLAAGAGLPALAVWREPDLPLAVPDPLASRPLRKWRPGRPGLDPGALADALLSEFPDLAGPFGAALGDRGMARGLTALEALWRGGDGRIAPPTAPVAGATLHLMENATAAALLDGLDLGDILGTAPAMTIHVRVQSATAAIDSTPDPARVLDMREAGRDPLAFTPLADAPGDWHILLAPRPDAALPSGDPDGIRGQVARLKHALSAITQAGATVVADAAAAHAAWIALDEMGTGPNRLVTVGMALTPAQGPAAPDSVTAEVLRRLDEFLPAPDAAEPDDADLAAARALIAAHLGAAVRPAAEVQPPAGWTGTARSDLQRHLLYGVHDRATIRRAMTAALAAGLSLNAQARAVRRKAQRIDSASLGAWLPLSAAPGGGLTVEGHALAELVGLDIGAAGPVPRPPRRVAAALEIRRAGGWLIGGPVAAAIPLDLELRSVEIALRLGTGGGDTARDRCEVILHGVRFAGQSFPRLTLSADVAEGDLGVDGLVPPTAPEIRSLLTSVLQDLTASADPALARVAEALRAAGILGAGDGFDPLSLSNWIDAPTARLAEVWTSPALRDKLVAVINGVAGAQAGVSYDSATRSLSVTAGGATGAPIFTDWALTGTLSASGTAGGSLRLGAVGETHLAVTFSPFAAALNFASEDAEALGGLPARLPLYPAPDIQKLGKPLLPAMAATALSRMLDGVRAADANAKLVLDPALAAFDLLDGARVRIPTLMFANPALWLKRDTVLGTSGGVIRADRVIAVMDALRPFVGLSGASGVWQIEAGIALRARNSGGLVLDLALDPAAFMTGADVDFGGAFGLRFPASGGVEPAIAVHVGLPGGAADRRAVHLEVQGSAARLFLRPQTGADLEIFPDSAGIAQLATAGVTAALPPALDAIVDTGSDAGNLLADIGDALQLRTGGSFDGAALSAWASDPAGQLQARWPQLLGTGLSRLGPALPAGITVTPTAGGVEVSVADAGTTGSTITLGLTSGPFTVGIGASLVGLPFVGEASATLAFDAAGLSRLQAALGPAEVPVADAISLRPVLALDVGSAAPAAQIEAGLAVDAANTDALVLRYRFDAGTVEMGFGGDTPAEVAAGLMHMAIDLLGGFILDIEEVDDLLKHRVGGSEIGDLMADVVLTSSGGLDPELFRVVPRPGESPTQFAQSKLERVYTLLEKLALAGPSVTIGGEVTISLTDSGGSIGLSVSLANRLAVVDGDIKLWIENDNRWIIDTPPAGLSVGLLRRDAGSFAFDPTLGVNGVGLRLGRNNAPLLDSPIALGSVAFHTYASLGGAEALGGVQVQLSEIAVAVGGAEGGNPIAQGMLAETNEGDATLAPAFSPALSIQTRPAADGGDIAFRFVAGEGEGPWWLPIRSQFGPIYIDQIGLGTQVQNDTMQSISVLFDGNVSIAGLEAAVDDLELRHSVGPGTSIFDPSDWAVDLAGLAVSADLSGVSLAGGLRKFGEDDSVEYIGMLTARFATYGLSIFGGYASVTRSDGRFSAFFAFGAVLGPIGGPPAFFLTGIGGGFGINRDVVPPDDMDDFDDFVMIAALDPSFDPPGGLMEYMGEIRDTFPPDKGRFWFAAGISFTSFALVDGIAVVALEFGEGFELSIFGLARMALPRPEAALVSIELGLIARFSTEEGVIWVQAQLTSNSWLLHSSARLTGGFAYVSWFKGDKAGEFVLTMGGYHPNFHRDGYPVVPRLGFNWSVSNNIVIKSECYFALTSEAIMAGGQFEASARFGPAYAHLSYGGNAIVYFDPFRYEADAHARVSAGIRIDTWFGTIKLGFSLGAYIEVRGPEFHGKARIEVGPIDITVRFGNSGDPGFNYISWTDFAKKYLELAPGNKARSLSGIAGKGALPPSSNGSEEAGTADGTAAHPFDVLAEFELSLTSTIPIGRILREDSGHAVTTPAPSKTLGIAPCGRTIDQTTLTLKLRRKGDGATDLLTSRPDHVIVITARGTGRFPMGVWGLPGKVDGKAVPKGKVITATEGVHLEFKADPRDKIPDASTGGVSFHQVEPGKQRKPLPLKAAGTLRARLVREAQDQRAILRTITAERMPQIATDWHRVDRSATQRRSWLRERAVPMRVGLLSERIVGSAAPGRKSVLDLTTPAPGRVSFGAAKLRGLIAQPVRVADAVAEARTTVTDAAAGKLKRVAPPRLDSVLAERKAASAALLRAEIDPPVAGGTLVARTAQPQTHAARAPISVGAGRSPRAERDTLNGVETMLTRGTRRRRGAPAPRALTPGEIAVTDLPTADASPRFATSGEVEIRGAARLVVLGADGGVRMNRFPATGRITLPRAAHGFAVIAGQEPEGAEAAGWLATSEVAYLGQSLARCRGGFLRAEGASRSRGGARAGCGWIGAARLVEQSRLIETRFDAGAQAVAVVLEGRVTEADLARLAASFEGAEPAATDPLLVPHDGKTLVVFPLAGAGEADFVLHIGGLVAGRLAGVIAARMEAGRLVTRIVNESLSLDLESIAGAKSEPVTAVWTAPADLDPEPVE
ncbi:hypothetical protein SAMN05444722_1519 [Rhodovulum sp. ES.010]|uniref:DUF6603 domain-containing protein n=1 Tax=Rhodovulum sp. ES.010 TaxID=1882821 RepID=UPI00092B5A0E|nr:DUF6603 domain-containing protein [Rhodovulum sp. ES.010]SIO33796.1 hypothetical protein SAMN05444722_1519 [Rhodovulum sp. ES.010]